VGAAVLAQFRSDLQRAQEALMQQPSDATKQATVATIAPDAAGLGPQIDSKVAEAKLVRTRISAPTPPALQKPARSRLCLDPSQPGIGAGADTRGLERSYKDLVSFFQGFHPMSCANSHSRPLIVSLLIIRSAVQSESPMLMLLRGLDSLWRSRVILKAAGVRGLRQVGFKGLGFRKAAGVRGLRQVGFKLCRSTLA
jgi:hypothetical protein